MMPNEGELVAFVVSPNGRVENLPMYDDNMIEESEGVFTSPIHYKQLSEAVGGLIEYVPFHHLAREQTITNGEGDNIIPLPDGRWGRLLELIVNEEGKMYDMGSNMVGASFANWGQGPNGSTNFFIVGPTIVVAEVVDVGNTEAEDFVQYVGGSIPLEVWATYGESRVALAVSAAWGEWYVGHGLGGEEE